MYNHPSLSILLILHSSCYEYSDGQEEIIHSIRVQILKTAASQVAAPLAVSIFKVKNQQIRHFKTYGSLKYYQL